MQSHPLTGTVGRRVSLPGHFDGEVTLEEARPLGSNGSGGYECRVRLADGTLEETILSPEEANALAGSGQVAAAVKIVDPARLHLLIESNRIRLAYTHDRQFAVSLSGIRTLPHQIEAVYQRMLPQPRLRFLLADDPDAGKTIMAGLLIKELRLREAIDRVLILCPAPLTIQWQDELQRWFGEAFDIIFSAVDQQQLTNPWQKSSCVNRVLKLRSPFGGGKSHTLAALLHAARDRSALDHIPEAGGLPNPGPVCAAVFDGEKVDARVGKVIEGGPTIQTMWGWLAWQIDPKRAYPLVEQHDKDRVAPGGDVIARMLTEGANGRPVLILLDEMLKYVERAGAVAIHDSTLQRQTKDFFQNLTVEVAGSARAVLVYSLTWSSREALDHIRLLEEIDKLAARVDQLREPVSADEVLPILQRRLLGAPPPASHANAVADAYSGAITNMWKAQATTAAEKHEADQAGIALHKRLVSAYPFHPALIDVMRERWASIESFQRTRGALRFLAGCLRSVKKKGGAGAILGPADVPLGDGEVLHNVVNLLGLKNDYDAAFTADLTGVNSRARQIDDRRGREYPSPSLEATQVPALAAKVAA